MQTGPSIYRSLTNTELQVTNEQARLSSQLSTCEQTISQTMAKRAALVAQLAERYMDPQVAGNLGGELSRVTTMLNQMHLAKGQRRTALQELLAQTRQRHTETMTTFAAAQEEEKALNDALAAKQAEAQTQVTAREDWQALAVQIQRRATELQAAEKARTRAEQLLTAKRTGYEHNASFRYLYRRTRPSIFPWIRSGDEWLANRLDFKTQKARYERLLARPKQIENIIAGSRAEQNAWVAAQQQIADGVAAQLGIPQLDHIREQKAKTRENLQRQVESLAAEINQLAGEMQGLMQNDSVFERDLKQQIGALLNQFSTEQLAAAAAQTSTPEDDQIVSQIRMLEAQIASAKQAANGVQGELAQKQAQVAGLANIRRRFEAASYGSQRSLFGNGLNINQLLMGYLAGSMAEHVIWGLIDEAQSWRQEARHQAGMNMGNNWGNWGGNNNHSNSGGGGGIFGGGSDFGSGGGGGSSWGGGSSDSGGGGGGWSTTDGV
ncbi:MAG TPA: hypothetical protein VF607_15825 [Verrucomicrobiae bacterium]